MASTKGAADRPPRARCTLAVGITGHRASALPAGTTEPLLGRLAEVLELLQCAVGRVFNQNAEVFDPARPVLRFVTALADGADQIGARAALDAGFQIQAVLPFASGPYAETMDSTARANFADLLSRCESTLELPGRGDDLLDAYVMAGRATVAHCDVLIAVWDGLPARGRGGTGEVVELALRAGAPVIHVPLDQGLPLTTLWSGFDSYVAHARSGDIPAHPFDADRLLAALIGPPADPVERACLDVFHGELQRRTRVRIEYPLLLALTGARPLRRSSVRILPFATTTRIDWTSFRDAVDDQRHGVHTRLDSLEAAFCWSDGLAQHFAQTYRSSHIFNFTLAAFAVLLALSGLMMHDLKLWLTVAELAAIVAFVANTRIGTDQAWQRRWLDYRQLAERLRPMRSLKMLGVAEPDRYTSAGAGERWIDWYATRIWRAEGCAAGVIADDRAEAITAFVLAEELRPQIAYHRANAGQIRKLDHRLHQAGMVLFIASILSCIAFIVLYYVDHPWVLEHAKAFVVASAGLPALGSAIFGIRVQGDFGGTAERSLATAARLEWIATAFDGRVGLQRAADLVEAAARTMVVDLAEWRLSHQQRRLEIPG